MRTITVDAPHKTMAVRPLACGFAIRRPDLTL